MLVEPAQVEEVGQQAAQRADFGRDGLEVVQIRLPLLLSGP